MIVCNANMTILIIYLIIYCYKIIFLINNKFKIFVYTLIDTIHCNR